MAKHWMAQWRKAERAHTETFRADLGVITLEVVFDPPNDEWIVTVLGYTMFQPAEPRYKSLIDAQAKAETYAAWLLNNALNDLKG